MSPTGPQPETQLPETQLPETQLPGGTSNRGLVMRIGDTVHRPQTWASPSVHALLLHLERVGFDGAPRYLGQDEQGREVLNYLPGQAATEPHPPWALHDDALVSVAVLLRRYHDAVASFDPSRYSWLTSVPAEYRDGLVSHNDPNLDNVIFRDGRAVALIDFDLASPGSRLWDVALAARLWVPLRDPVDVADQHAGRTAERLRLFIDVYGLDGEERSRLVAAASRSHTWCYDIVRAGAERGQLGYVDYWTSDTAGRAERGRRWLAEQQDALRQALTS